MQVRDGCRRRWRKPACRLSSWVGLLKCPWVRPPGPDRAWAHEPREHQAPGGRVDRSSGADLSTTGARSVWRVWRSSTACGSAVRAVPRYNAREGGAGRGSGCCCIGRSASTTSGRRRTSCRTSQAPVEAKGCEGNGQKKRRQRRWQEKSCCKQQRPHKEVSSG